MADILFHIFSILIIGSAFAVVYNHNAVNSALAFLMCLVGVSGMFVLLDSFLLAALMILVYAGAVVALFLFIIMLLDMQGGERKKFSKATAGAGLVGAGLLVVCVMSLMRGLGTLHQPDAASVIPVGATLKNYADQLFTTYLLPVQVVGFLLLIAMLGVIVLSKKFEGLEDVK
ncbi:NADH-quinone oxidoreductase subunit J family protein [Synoicihabitans lomoniglobus]|uniref:NADH-quinone oxidoreductase subunit J n=1 Tax=Synoicihabitans lomoniglobus TaxID=2909285 RepID=A0AAE9ZWX4_9BACT|nr:NADH-quinone oxidoreductase subunit J [Opitutaceae bacterium LMO-M01]WED64946.1 NADH-quinone oxidoreductase subunit J [Opitutaceae bacterium LMO-M01]